MDFYGYDHGHPDLDLPRNRDYDALDNQIEATRVDSPATSATPPIKGWYYADPVKVNIPRSLGQLPHTLLGNPVNMMYFHYFLDYTSKVLVTHECASNPFRTILPRLAIEDDNLLSLILAYAACHRARLLCHAEPINRISSWVTRLFPAFRQALAENKPVSDALFGTAVMLASLMVSFPQAFALSISWQGHLSVAKQMLELRYSQGSPQSSIAGYFFTRWFAYLDTFGSLSGNVYDGSYKLWSRTLLSGEKNPELKCLVGHTNSTLVLLGRTAELCKLCDYERKTLGQPSTTTITTSQQLRVTLELATLEVQHKRYDCSCSASSPSTDVYRAVNAALCHAGLIYLHRRIYLLPSSSHLVQTSVAAILEALNRNERFNPIDIPDIILPLFLAGCEASNDQQKSEVLRRLERIGNAGMSQVTRVRALLYECWNSKRSWTEIDHDVLLG